MDRVWENWMIVWDLDQLNQIYASISKITNIKSILNLNQTNKQNEYYFYYLCSNIYINYIFTYALLIKRDYKILKLGLYNDICKFRQYFYNKIYIKK